MAPPVNRRSGSYSRRVQYRHFVSYVIGVGGVLIGAILLVLALADHTRFAGWRSAASDATVPLGRLGTGARGGTDHAIDTLSGYFTYGAEVARLRREVALARVNRVQTAALSAENQRLKAMLGLSAASPHAVATAWLIASTAASTRRFATISAGWRQGVRPGMPVRTPIGLVGRVLEVGQVSARVLLLTDPESIVPVRRASDGLPAFASGRADGTLQIRLISLGVNPLRAGDAFVASGSGGLYWPGTPIAVVRDLTHDGAIAALLGDPAASDAVEVLPEWNPAADRTLPPPTQPAPPMRHRK